MSARSSTAQVIPFRPKTGGDGFTHHITTTTSAVRTYDPFRQPDGGGQTPPPPGGHDVEIATLRQSVDWLWKIAIGTVVIGLGALTTLFLVLDDRLQDRFEITDNKITAVSEKIGDVRVAIEGLRTDSQNPPERNK